MMVFAQEKSILLALFYMERGTCYVLRILGEVHGHHRVC